MIKSLGYDEFIGRGIYDGGSQYFVALDLHSLGYRGCVSLSSLLESLCISVRDGMRVLLTKSPGRIEPTKRCSRQTLSNLSSVLNCTSGDCGDILAFITGEDAREEYVTLGITFEPLKPADMLRLQFMYTLQREMGGFPDPFEDQPS